MNSEKIRKIVEKAIKKRKMSGYKWIRPSDVIVSNWVRMKCMFGCTEYDNNLTCPPNTPAIEECRAFFGEYKNIVLFHFEVKVSDPEKRHKKTREINARLLKLERDVFLAGFQKAFVIYIDPCNFCETCNSTEKECENRKNARPSAEGLGVDVFSTVKNASMPISVLTDYSDTMNRYGILLVD